MQNPITLVDFEKLRESQGVSAPWLSRRIFSGLTKYEAFRYVRELYEATLANTTRFKFKFLCEKVKNFLNAIGPGWEPKEVQQEAYNLLLEFRIKLKRMKPRTHLVSPGSCVNDYHYRKKDSCGIGKCWRKETAIRELLTSTLTLLAAFAGLEEDDELVHEEYPYATFSYGGRMLPDTVFINVPLLRSNSWHELFWEIDNSLSGVLGDYTSDRKFDIKMAIINKFRKAYKRPPPGALSPAEYYSNYNLKERRRGAKIRRRKASW